MQNEPTSISGGVPENFYKKKLSKIQLLVVAVISGILGVSLIIVANAATPAWNCGWGSFSRDNFPSACWRPYSDSAAYNSLLPANPKVAPNSNAVVANLMGTDGAGAGSGEVGDLFPIEQSFGDYNHPYFFSSPNDPEYSIVCDRAGGVWIGCPQGVYGQKVRVPAYAKPASGSDAHMVIIDQASGYIWDFLEAKPPSGGVIHAGTVGKAKIDSTGHYPQDTTCANAVCTGLLAGVIRQQEIAAGNINHALFAVVDCSALSSGPEGRTFPANPGNDDPGCANSLIPQGGWFQLNLSEAQINALPNISDWQKTILKALSKYGMFVGDEGSNRSFEFQAEGANTYIGQRNPWIDWANQERSKPNNNINGSGDNFTLGVNNGLSTDFWAKNLRLIDPCVIEKTCGGTQPPTPPPDTTAPTINLTAPSAGSTISGTVAVSANAADNTGVAGVQFKLDGNNLGSEDTSSPYSISWNTAAANSGNHTLTAVARDAADNMTTSGSVSVTVAAPPSTGDTTPPNTSITSGPQNPTASTNASFGFNGSDNTTASGNLIFECKLDTGAFATCSSPKSYSDLAVGQHTFSVRARDAAGNTDASPAAATWSINAPSASDNTPPTVAITSPTGGTVSGTITLSANANDPGSSTTGIAGVQFKLNGQNLAAETTTAPYRIDLDTKSRANGAYILTAIARDGAGNTTTSSPISFTVNNPAPPGQDTTKPFTSITAPINGATVAGLVTVQASASDNNSVSRVDFVLDGGVVYSDTTTPYTFTGDSTQVDDGSHTLQAKAYDPAGNVGSSAVVTVTIKNHGSGVDQTAPIPPGNLVGGAVSPTQVKLTWVASTDNVGVTQYYVQRDGAVIAILGGNATSYSDASVAGSQTYKYVVLAKDAAGNISQPSNTATVSTPAPPTENPAPPAPSNLVASAVSPSQINLSWSAPKNVSIHYYQIFRNGQQAATVKTLSYGDANLSPSTTYSYTVKAVDYSGKVSEASNIASATTAPVPIDSLRAGQYLLKGQSLRSTNGQYALYFQGDGNLVVYGPNSSVLWDSGTYSTSQRAAGNILVMQTDGNLVIYDASWRAIWDTKTYGTGSNNRLVMQTDGNLVIYTAGNKAVWSWRTGRI